MANKFEIIGSSLVITDTVTSGVIFDQLKDGLYYSIDELNDGNIQIESYYNSSRFLAPHYSSLAEAIDANDVSFTESTFITFVRDNLGFSLASRGGAAPDYWIDRAIQNIEADYGDVVSVVNKNKSLIKYGINEDIDAGTQETVWTVGGNETYPTGNTIDIVTSTSGSDTQEVVIEGHTLSGSDLTFASQTATLNGTADVTLSTPLYRANRIYNNNATNFVGDVTVEDNGTSVNLKCLSGEVNQSLKCATSLSSTDYWIVTALDISVKRANAAAVDFQLQVREFGKVWRTRYFVSSNSSAGGQLFQLNPCIVIKKNSDIRMVATSAVNNTGVSASIHGVLASIV